MWNASYAQPKTLSYEEFLGIVKQYHPVAQQAALQVSMAEAELLSSQGAFDPAFYTNKNQKEFSNKNYYNYFSSELKIPTWYGIDFKAGTESNGGFYTSNELTLGQSSYVGLQANVGKGLLMDKRRAAVLQSRKMVSLSEEEKRLLLNDLMYDATFTFYEWRNAHEQKRLIDSTLANNRKRYAFIKTLVKIGERPAIDTTEALTQLQNFEIQQLEATQNVMNTTWELSSFLWQTNEQSYLLSPEVLPQDTPLQFLFSLESYLEETQSHPKLKQTGIKTEVLEIEKKLKFQSLLPTVNLQYNVLNKGYTFLANPSFFQNNYKWGFTVGMPLFLREARGDYRKATLKITQQNWQNTLLLTQLNTKVRQYYTTAIQFANQLKVYENAVKNYQKLYEGELIRFENGESSLFLINSREVKWLEAQQKLVSLRNKTAKSIIGVRYASGNLWYN